MSSKTGQRGASHRAADGLLLRVARHGGPWLVVLAVTALSIACAETALPAVLGRAVDAIVGKASQSWLTWAGLLVGFLVVCDVLDDLATGSAVAESTAWLRHSVLGHVLALGTRAGRFAPGDLAARLVGNAADAGRVGPGLEHLRADTGSLEKDGGNRTGNAGADDDGFAGWFRHALLLISERWYEIADANYLSV